MKSLTAGAAIAACLMGMSLGLSGAALAFDLDGAWASDAENCAKVFVRKDKQVAFTEMSDVYGGGFIIDGDHITGTNQRARHERERHLAAASHEHVLGAGGQAPGRREHRRQGGSQGG